MSVCVCERERDIERERKGGVQETRGKGGRENARGLVVKIYLIITVNLFMNSLERSRHFRKAPHHIPFIYSPGVNLDMLNY